MMLKHLLKEKKKWEELLDKLQKELLNLPSGRLRVSSSNNCVQYFVDGKYVHSNDISEVKKIAVRDYYTKLITDINTILNKITELTYIYEHNHPDKQYNDLCEGRRRLIDNTVYMPTERMIEEFMKCQEDIQQNTYEIKGDIYTNNNEHVRSKSEKIIADELYRRDILYKYEAPLKLKDDKRSIIIYPDFTAFNKRTRQIIYIEHLGMMDEFEYVYKNINKISLYEKNNILIGKNLIILHETYENPLSVKNLGKYIDEFLI